MKTLHLNLVYSVPEGSEVSFVELVNAHSKILGMQLLDLRYLNLDSDGLFLSNQNLR